MVLINHCIEKEAKNRTQGIGVNITLLLKSTDPYIIKGVN